MEKTVSSSSWTFFFLFSSTFPFKFDDSQFVSISEFSWENVKTDKFRENYLGQTLFLDPLGRKIPGAAKPGDRFTHNNLFILTCEYSTLPKKVGGPRAKRF